MPRLNYVGPDPATSTEILNRIQGSAIIGRALNSQNAASTLVEAAASTRAGKSYIDLADANYVTVDYYQDQDALNVATTKVGQPNGVASLVGGKIPDVQIPVLGSGYLKGPFGPTTVTTALNATTTKVKVADFAIGVQSLAFQPLAYAVVAVDTKPGGRPILEMRISNGTAAYDSQTLIAQGIGRPMYDGRQMVTVTPASAAGGSNPTPFASNTNIVVSLWVYSSSTTPVTVGASSLLSAAVFLMRMTA